MTAHILVVVLKDGQFYNIMLQMNNIRFSFEEKNQYFANEESGQGEKEGIGRVLTKQQRSNHFDDQQEQQIKKKKTIYNGNSINYSQIYSDIRLNRNEKVSPQQQIKNQSIKYRKQPNINADIANQDFPGVSTTLYAPKSLPKIMRNSRVSQHVQSSFGKNNGTQNEISLERQDKSNVARGKTFSISHYDIYKPGFLVNRKSVHSKSKQQTIKEDKISQKNSSFARSQFHQELQQQIPQEAIKINFESQSDHDLPEAQQVQQEQYNQLNHSLKAKEPKLSSVKNNQKKNEDQQIYNNRKQKSQKTEIKEDISTINNKSKVIENKDILIQKQSIKIIQPNPIKQQNMKEQKVTLKRQVVENKVNKQQNNNEHLYENFVQQRQKRGLNINETVLKRPARAKINDSNILKHIEKDSKIQEQRKEVKYQKQQPQFNKKQNKFMQLTQIKPLLSAIRKGRENQSENSEYRMVQNQLSSKEQHLENQVLEGDHLKKKQQTYRPYQFFKFNINDYMRIYEILKSIQGSIKSQIIDNHCLIKEIKNYLEIVAGGSLDHIEGYDMPLHRLKIIKNALLYERIAIVIISFAYAVTKIKDCIKYIINLITYATHNTLLILKILQSSEVNKQFSKNPIIAKSDRLVLKKNYDTVRNNSDIILDSIFKISKYQQAFSESFKDIIKSVGKTSLQQTFYNVLQYFAFFLCVSELHMSIPFLAVAPNPYLRETIDSRPTLVIDIVEIFCHGTRKSKSHVFRPHTQHFLNQMGQFYQIVSFTCAYPNQIDKVIDILDSKNQIKHRLYRHHAILRNNLLFKDTERIGRDLNKLILLDSSMNTITGESNNTIMIPIWKGNKSDTTLAQLCPLLAAIAIKHLDCRQATRKIHEQQIKNQNEGIKYLNFGINLQ